MDCQIPEMDRFAATAAMREREAGTEVHVPIITMIANGIGFDAITKKWIPSILPNSARFSQCVMNG
jgi:hypothetical protein